MLDIHHLPGFDIVLVRAAEPFELRELEMRGRAAMAAGGEAARDLNRPTLFDFRKVNLMRFESAEFQRVIARRQGFGDRHPNNPAAFVVRNGDDYGMMRMYAAHAASYGLRDIDRSFVTERLEEAATWLLAMSGGPEDGAPALLAALQAPPPRHWSTG